MSAQGASTPSVAVGDEEIPGFPVLICTRIPPSSTDPRGSAECVLHKATKRYLSHLPNYLRSPAPPPSTVRYVIKKADPIARGMFSVCPLDIGDLIFVERPHIVLPMKDTIVTSSNQDAPPLDKLIAIMRSLFRHMSRDEVLDYMALPNAHHPSGLTSYAGVGIFLTNAIVVNVAEENGIHPSKYGAVSRLLSRINHSCRPNCMVSFDPESFSIEVRTSKAIACNEEVLVSYCDPAQSYSMRYKQLSNHRTPCSCSSCYRDSMDDTGEVLRSTICVKLQQIGENIIPAEIKTEDTSILFETFIKSKYPLLDYARAKGFYDEIRALLQDMEREGLDGCACYSIAWDMYTRACVGMVTSGSATDRLSADYRDAYITNAKLILAHKGSFRAPEYDFLNDKGVLGSH